MAAHEARQVTREGRADRRLTKAAILLASIIGVAQLIAAILTMSPDSIGYRWLKTACAWLYHFTRAC
jgi:hypothetical protein